MLWGPLSRIFNPWERAVSSGKLLKACQHASLHLLPARAVLAKKIKIKIKMLNWREVSLFSTRLERRNSSLTMQSLCHSILALAGKVWMPLCHGQSRLIPSPETRGLEREPDPKLSSTPLWDSWHRGQWFIKKNMVEFLNLVNRMNFIQYFAHPFYNKGSFGSCDNPGPAT